MPVRRITFVCSRANDRSPGNTVTNGKNSQKSGWNDQVYSYKDQWGVLVWNRSARDLRLSPWSICPETCVWFRLRCWSATGIGCSVQKFVRPSSVTPVPSRTMLDRLRSSDGKHWRFFIVMLSLRLALFKKLNGHTIKQVYSIQVFIHPHHELN